MDKQDLLKLKDKIDAAKRKESEAIGELNAVSKTLKNDWKCNSPTEAQELIEEKKNQRKKLKKKLEAGTNEIEKILNNET